MRLEFDFNLTSFTSKEVIIEACVENNFLVIRYYNGNEVMIDINSLVEKNEGGVISPLFFAINLEF